MLPIADYLDPGYKIVLFLHITAVVVAFGPTFGYALTLSVLPQFPRSAPAVIAGMQRIDRYLVNPGMIVLLVAAILLLITGSNVWDGSDFFIVWGFIAIIALFGVQHGFFFPTLRRLGEMAERDVAAGDELSPEFEAVNRQYGQVGAAAGLLVLLTVFFMVYKPFM